MRQACALSAISIGAGMYGIHRVGQQRHPKRHTEIATMVAGVRGRSAERGMIDAGPVAVGSRVAVASRVAVGRDNAGRAVGGRVRRAVAGVMSGQACKQRKAQHGAANSVSE